MAGQKGNTNSKTHGMKKTRFYSIWVGMKTRCLNKNHMWFKHYGGKGVKIDDRWLNFIGFMEDMHKSYEKHVAKHGEKQTTLDRIDGNKNYCKDNCRWATRFEQSNNVSNSKTFRFKGRDLTVSQIARITGFKQAVLYRRLFIAKMPIEVAVLKVDFTKKEGRKIKNNLINL